MSSTVRFSFRIRTRHGPVVDNLVIQGRDEAEAEKKLRQMYHQCEVLQRTIMSARDKSKAVLFAPLASLGGE